MKKPMNILYLHSHDTGRSIQPYGHAVPTPNLQRLAEEGMLFRQAFNAAPTCSPSRACLLTGAYAHSNGMLGLAHRGFALRDSGQHLAAFLRAQGYTTRLSGVQHEIHAHAGDPDAWRKLGYQERLGEPLSEHQEQVAAFLSETPRQPFFLSVGFFETHREFPETPTVNPNHCLPPAPLPDTPETRMDMARYISAARCLDHKIGVVLDALDRSGLSDNTLVICTTDHGIAFPRMKCNLTDAGIGVMLILRGPGGFTGGRVVDDLVSQVDLFPTLCDLLDLSAPEWVQGQSLMPRLRGEAAPRTEVFAEVNYHAAYEPQRCIRTQRWKYIRRYDNREAPVLPNCDNGESKSAWMEAGWTRRSPENEALYDLMFDPHETNNLVAAPHTADVVVDLRDRLDRWMRETQDPLIRQSTVPAPTGAIITPADRVSPDNV